jgi:hypothetical protein
LAAICSGSAAEDEKNAVDEGDGHGQEEPRSPNTEVSLVDFARGELSTKQDDDR